MGKAKRRSFNKEKNVSGLSLSRDNAVNTVVEMLRQGNREAYGLVTLFGLSAEELLEAGASYESVIGIKGLLK